MHRSNRGVRVGTLALQLLLLLSAGNVACKNDGSGRSINVIDASAGDGNSTDGAGGSGKSINFWIDYGGAGSIEVTSSGSVDASFTPAESFAPELGAHPLVVTSDLSIPVVTSAPFLARRIRSMATRTSTSRMETRTSVTRRPSPACTCRLA